MSVTSFSTKLFAHPQYCAKTSQSVDLRTLKRPTMYWIRSNPAWKTTIYFVQNVMCRSNSRALVDLGATVPGGMAQPKGRLWFIHCISITLRLDTMRV